MPFQLFVEFQIATVITIAIKEEIVLAQRNDMGFKKPMDYNSVHHQIYIAGVEMNNPRNDGFTTFEIKKDLYKLKWMLDQIMKDAPTYTGEDEFVKEHEKRVMWRTLKQ